MPINVYKAAARTTRTTITLDGQSAGVVFKPGKVTGEMVGSVQEQQGNIHVLASLLAEVLVDWDITGTPDDPAAETVKWPMDARSIAKLPLELINVIFSGIFEAINPNSTPSAGNSPGGSAETASSGSAPSGTASSERANTWG